ncbi:MAG: helix-turn-helix domain-containing protein [Prevotella sp.]|nr:helix-turn-helix domain-containing protein [Prevotella sp.]
MKTNLRTTFLFLFLMVSSLLSASGAEEERSFKIINSSSGLADNCAQIVKCTKTGRIVISTIGNLNFYDGRTFTHADVDASCEYPLPLYRGHYHLYFDRHHHIWLKDKRKVTVLDLMMEKFVHNVDSVLRAMGCSEPVLDVFGDQYNQMWFVTNNGIFSPRFGITLPLMRDTSRNLQDVDMARGVIYSFYDNGEVVGHDTIGNIVCHTQPYDWEKGQDYAASSVLMPYGDNFYQIRNGETKAILLFFDTASNTFTEVMSTDYHINNMVLDETTQKIYIPCEYGYWILDPATGEKEHLEHIMLDNGTLLATDCNTIAIDRQGGLWIGTEKRGILYARPHSQSFKVYNWNNQQALDYDNRLKELEAAGRLADVAISNFNGQRANCKFTDSRGWTWTGSRVGLYLDRPGMEQKHFSRLQGMNNEVVHSIIEDKDHNIWAATSCGITFFLVRDGEVAFINNFTEDDNVPAESFENCMAMILDDGTIVMKAVEHVVAFNPATLHEVNYPHLITNIKPKLIRLMVSGDIVEPGIPMQDNIVIDRAVSRVKHINLNSSQNSITLSFSALNYYRPTQTYYRVKVTEMGDTWEVFSSYKSNNVDNQGVLNYTLTNLKPGNYHIEVQSSMFPDIWEDDMDPAKRFVWEIHVKQPWWRTTGLFFLFAMVLLALLIVNFFLFNRNSIMKNRRNAEEGDVIRKITFFAERCESYSKRMFTPAEDDYGKQFADPNTQLSPEFTKLMKKLMPYINENMDKDLTMSSLSKVGGLDISKLYDVVIGNLYKSPRELAKKMKLENAATMLRETDKTVEEIASESGFYTPNYFIGNFFHQYKMTPAEYRERKK